MPRETRTVRVAEIPGEVMRFHVESWTKAQRPHVVDLLANDGAGECSCADWATRRGPALRAGAPMHTPETLCRHVQAAHRFFLRRLLPRMARDHNPTT